MNQLSLFDHKQEPAAEPVSNLPRIKVIIDGRESIKQVSHILNGHLYVYDVDGLTYSVPIEIAEVIKKKKKPKYTDDSITC